MFIRSVQTFELVYRQVVRCLSRAVTALENGDTDTRRTKSRTPTAASVPPHVLSRVLTTMSREAFASIRAHTDGRSAVRSRAYREVEHMSAMRPPGPPDPKSARVSITSVAVQEAFTRSVEVLGAERMQPVAAALLKLDHDWQAMTRTGASPARSSARFPGKHQPVRQGVGTVYELVDRGGPTVPPVDVGTATRR